MKTTVRGDLTVLAVAFALAKRGERILMPFSEAERYDLALDRGGRLYRIQCKSGHLKKDRSGICFKTSSWGPRVSRRRYEGEIEAFGVYCPEVGESYLVPIEAVAGQNSATLRIEHKKLKPRTSVRFAADFKI